MVEEPKKVTSADVEKVVPTARDKGKKVARLPSVRHSLKRSRLEDLLTLPPRDTPNVQGAD